MDEYYNRNMKMHVDDNELDIDNLEMFDPQLLANAFRISASNKSQPNNRLKK